MKNTEKKGKLKIFFGYCAGVGKTYAMLQEAQQKSVEGWDVVCGYIEPHDRKETYDLIYGLEQLPLKQTSYRGKVLYEFDIDNAIKRHPQIILVDELAHTNVPESKHEKRYSDIEELLRAGIDVYTTINVQHLESLHDTVEGITHIHVQERVPDHIFDSAYDVKLVDIEIDELLERLQMGKIYPKQKVDSALHNFFIKDNLTSLRAIALRRCAERVNLITSTQKRAYTKEHILVCLGSSPTNQKVLRTASRMVQAFHTDFTALFVETQQVLSKKAEAQLQQNMKLARHLGADIVSTYGEDIAYQIGQYARTASVSKLVIGRSFQKPSMFQHKTLVDQITLMTTDLEIYIIPDIHSEAQKRKLLSIHFEHIHSDDIKITIAILIFTTIIALFLYYLQPDPTNIIMLFVLAACFIGAKTLHPMCSIITACSSILIINFFFIKPRFSLQIHASQYTLIFICLIAVSLTISAFTRKLNKEKTFISLHAHSMDVLLETSQKLQICTTKQDIMYETCYQLHRMLQRYIMYYPAKHQTLKKPYVYGETVTKEIKEMYCSPTELVVAKWVLANNKNAGVSTSTLPNAKALYLAIRKNDVVFAVIGIAMNPHEELPQYEKGLLKALLNEVALALDAMK